MSDCDSHQRPTALIWYGIGILVLVGGLLAALYVGFRGNWPSSLTSAPPARSHLAELGADAAVGEDRTTPTTADPAPRRLSTNGSESRSDSPTPALGIAAMLADREPPRSADAVVDEAKQIITRLLASFADSADAHEIAGRFYALIGDNRRAISEWQRCVTLDPQYGYAYHGMAKVALKRGESAEAIRLFRQALAVSPESVESQLELARLLVDQNHTDEAIRVLRKHVEQLPESGEGYVLLGIAYTEIRQFGKAKESYLHALKYVPNDLRAMFGLANACGRLKETDVARGYAVEARKLAALRHQFVSATRRGFDDLRAVRHDTANCYLMIARLCQQTRFRGDSVALWKRVTQFDPRNTESRESLARYYVQQQQYARAVPLLNQLAKLQPGTNFAPDLALLYAELGDLDQAEQTLRGAVEHDHVHDGPTVELALFLMQHNRHIADTIPLAKTAVARNPSADNYYLLSGAYERNGKLDQAIQAMVNATRVGNDAPRFRARLQRLRERRSREHESQ